MRRPLHQGADGRAIASPLDQVALPVAGHRAGRDFDGALGHRRHIGDLSWPGFDGHLKRGHDSSCGGATWANDDSSLLSSNDKPSSF